MSLANARDSTPGCLLSLNVGSSQHVVLDCLSEGTRADLWVGAVEGACSLEQMVVIKQFHPEAAAAAWGRLVAELELARGLQSEHVVRTVDVCLEPSRCFQVSEYAEGSTLRACLSWAAAKRIALPNAVLARILWAILAAVTHAEREARSAWSRALVYSPVTVDDVFITSTGQVKLLGFRGAQRQAGAGESPPPAAAIDALLQAHLTPQLSSVLRHVPRKSSDPASGSSHEILDALQRWRSENLRSDGRAELERLMRPVERGTRAQRALRIAAAFSKLRDPWRRVAAPESPDDAPPESGYRRIHARQGSTPPPLPAMEDAASLDPGP